MQRIVIAGDRTIDRFLYSQPAGDTGENWQLIPSIREFHLPGGVLLLEQLIRASLQLWTEVNSPAPVISMTPAPRGDLRLVSPDDVIQSSAQLEQVSAGKDKWQWRVGRALGFQGPLRTSSPPSEKPQPSLTEADLIVLDDHGNSFRNDESAWPESLPAWQGDVPIIHKMRHPLHKGRQPDALWACLESRLKMLESPQYVLIVSADDLRETEGVQISKGLSWERTAKELLFQLQYAPALKPLQICPCIVVLFGWDGAIVCRRTTQPTPQFTATLHFDSQRTEGGFESENAGRMFGMTSTFVATLVGRIVIADKEARKLSGSGRPDLFDTVDGAVPEGLARARLWLETAFGSRQLPCSDYPVQTVFPKPGVSPKPGMPLAEDVFSWTTIPPVSSSVDPDPAGWRIINQEWTAISVLIAMEYVRAGSAPGLLRSPAGVFGKLKTVDRLEIESFNSVRALVQEFLNAKSRKRPLCIGVFGPPGAGKSFGVEEVISSIGGDSVAKLTFNVSQFSSEKDLVAACHRIRDRVLEGKTPFVFFDEFDSAGPDGRPLGWLRSFLALMQDGKFRDGEEMHPLGKCILVFAGGTSATFVAFEEQAMNSDPAIKGRDFVSRLHGYIDIMGPNPHGGNDPACFLRRAIVLRSLLERNKDARGLFNSKKELQIDNGVLRALLLVPEYKHGTRSLESLLDMSQLEGQTRFDQYALPPRNQMLIHVKPDDFMPLMQPLSAESAEITQFKGWLSDIGYEVRPIPAGRACDWGGTGDRPQTPLIEDDRIVLLAKSAHHWWCEGQRAVGVVCAAEEKPGVSTPYLCDYDQLPLAIQKLIVSRVEQIPLILHDAGLEIIKPNEAADWDDAAMIDRLAEIVHGSYQATVDSEAGKRRNAGFLPKFNSNAKPFQELPAAKKESNRDSVRTIPRKLGRIGLTLIPRDPASTVPAEDVIKRMAAKIEPERERLAVIEHTRWNWHTLLQSFVYKPGMKSDSRRTNPCILPWDKLPEPIREYDRVNPVEFAGLIFEAGYEIV